MATSTGKRELNAEQLKAVHHGEGPLLIIAGAGTGKTTVITERIKWLIEAEKASPGEILALTFTEKAAREMEERVDIAMPYGYTQMWISTFHSFCDRVLKLEALQIGLDPNYHLMTESEGIQFLRKNFFKFQLNYFRPLGNPTKFISGMLQHFSRLKDEDVSPGDYLAWAKKQVASNESQADEEKLESEKYLELAGAYRDYEELKAKEGVMDFADLIANSLKLFRSRPNVLRQYQQKFKYVLVDEFQDTNYAQNQLVMLLAGSPQNLTVVADDDQAIYRFRGAAVSNVIQFRENFPKTKIVTLIKNYRSTQEILDRAYDLIQHNNPDRLEVKEKINKRLVAQRKDKGAPVGWIRKDRVENEAEAVAKEIEKLTTPPKSSKPASPAGGLQATSYSDIAILVRANNHSDPFTRALARHGIPFQFLGPGQLFRQEEIKDLIAYLAVLANLEDDISFFRVLSTPVFDLASRDLSTISVFAKKYNLSLFETAEFIAEYPTSLEGKNIFPPFITTKSKDKIFQIVGLIHKHLGLIQKETAGQILYFFLESTGLLKLMIDPESEKVQKETQNISKFFDKLKTYEVEHEDASVNAVVDWIDLAMEVGESPLAADFDWSENNAVSILTVHSSKGLEFPVVFIVNLVSQRFPTTERREQLPIPEDLVKEILPEGDYHLEEERRLFYVGLTRAKDLAFLTSADYYGEGKREKKVSPFVYETLGPEAQAPKEIEVPQLSLLEWQKAPEPSGATATPQALHLSYISYSQIDTFELCPLHYRLKYLLNLQTPPTAAQSMGTTIHKVLHDFYYRKLQNQSVSQDDLDELLKIYWISEGYTSRQHETESLTRVGKFLKHFYATQYNPDQKPLLLEENFSFPLGSLKVGGKIDRVDDLGGGQIEIIDYKSGGTVPDQKIIDKDLQMTIYAMAATRVPHPPFAKQPEEVKLSFYYFESGSKISTTRSLKDFSEAQEKITEVVKTIETSDFKCSGSRFCLSCEYKMFCNPGAAD